LLPIIYNDKNNAFGFQEAEAIRRDLQGFQNLEGLETLRVRRQSNLFPINCVFYEFGKGIFGGRRSNIPLFIR